jgi:hypothetical protein
MQSHTGTACRRCGNPAKLFTSSSVGGSKQGAADRGVEIGAAAALECSVLAIGTVKWFGEQRGYGFITPEDGGKYLFCRSSNIVGEGFRPL